MDKKNENGLFSGVATALVTPFTEDGIDLPTFRRLIDLQINARVSALVVAGTTGEASTLKDKERDALLYEALKATEDRLPVILGCGSNDTERAVFYTKRAKELGAHAALVVTPYYNKGTRSGIRTHFLRIAEAADLPIVLYNVPSRTGVDLSLDDYAVLREHPNILGVKEASDSIEKMARLCAMRKNDFRVYTGNDCMLLPSLSLGADGIISVASGVLPSKMCEIFSLFREGKVEKAQEENARLLPLYSLLFRETNPSPIKYALSLLGLGNGSLRLPLEMPSEGVREEIAAWIKKLFKEI